MVETPPGPGDAEDADLARLAAWDAEVEAALATLDLAEELHAADHPYVALDEEGRVVIVHPDGRVERRTDV